MLIKIEIDNVLEIPLAYKQAIEEYKLKAEIDDIWDAKIEMLGIYFESNFRRSYYYCLFQIEEGSFCYPAQEKITPK